MIVIYRFFTVLFSLKSNFRTYAFDINTKKVYFHFAECSNILCKDTF
ncbi:hypothetical protein HMPREF0653_00379 [Prevotella disiens JCM 6334 = ATCC 29426]|uniref:Uncharacterized protein n=1 Tax=Prevotella disiens JCM 6334 = ATCC 29426 TaxID=1235811 RepID=A0ABP2Y9U4_9BACT|nr:hypothetical protein HMPREF0653_00379 [Prevotella disiens JCM 6334 = ATCC 29426]